MQIAFDPHPELAPRVFVTRFPAPLESLPSPAWLIELLSTSASVPLRSDDSVRAAVRDLLRHGGYKPTGRGKPASEYLLRAAQDGGLRSINLPVDACNVVSLHSGLPISVVDIDRLQAPLRIALATKDDAYVFNASGQIMDVAGLPCLFDATGASANAVKDSQRTKTSPSTRVTLSILWSGHALATHAESALRFYLDVLARAGASTQLSR